LYNRCISIGADTRFEAMNDSLSPMFYAARMLIIIVLATSGHARL
jgi:hypothetical protein